MMTLTTTFKSSTGAVVVLHEDGGSTINYSEIGSKVQYAFTTEELNDFWRKFWQSTDGAMATLACYARFKYNANVLRAEGRHAEADLTDANAACVYDRQVLDENRW